MRKATLDRQKLDRFARRWEDLYRAFPEARRKAAETMAESVKKDLNAQIQAANLAPSAKATVRSWQQIRLGSGGGWSAVSPAKGTVMSRDPRKGGWKMRQHTNQGKPVTAKQVTRWLERGHGTPPTGRKTQSYVRKTKTWHEIAERSGSGYVEGRLFYSWTYMKAVDHAIEAAEKLLDSISEEMDF